MARRMEQAERSKEGVEAAAAEPVGPFTLADIRKLIDAVEGTDVTTLVWSRGLDKVVIRRGQPVPPATPMMQPPPLAVPTPVPLAPVPAAAAAPSSAPAAKAETKPGVIVTSPFVGTFYRAPAPDAAPFVDVGTVVKKGHVLCIVEAMKLMNEIEAEVNGRIAEIYVQNATPVEFGEKLFRIEPV